MKENNAKLKSFFKIVQGSNYLITDSYENEYIVEFDQFKNIANNLFKIDADFITINNIIINKKYIFKIEPTWKLTNEQRNNQRHNSYSSIAVYNPIPISEETSQKNLQILEKIRRTAKLKTM